MGLESTFFEVAEDQPGLGGGDAAGDRIGMDKALAAVGRLRGEAVPRQLVEERAEDLDRIDDHSLPDARVGVDPGDGDDGEIGGKRLGVDLSGAEAVEGVADDGADAPDVEMLRAAADLLVAGEDKPDRAVRHLAALHEPGGGRHDHRHPRLVVGAQQRRAVGGDDRPADERLKFRIVSNADDARGVAGENDVAAGVAGMDDRLDISA